MDYIAVLTTPRTPSYLLDTLAHLDAAGAAKCMREVVCDGDVSTEMPLGWAKYILGAKPHGNLRAFFGVCKRAFERDADRLLYFEDDICLSQNAIQRMRQIGVPQDCAWTAFFDMKEIAPGTPAGVYRVSPSGVDGQGWWGFQSVMIPRNVFTWLLAHKKEILADAGTVVHCSDYFVGHALLRSPWPEVAVHVPSLVEHVGANTSSIWPGQGQYEVNRTAKNFLGSQEDATALPKWICSPQRVVEEQMCLPGNAARTPQGVWKEISGGQHEFLKRSLGDLVDRGFNRAPAVVDRQDSRTCFSFLPGQTYLPPHPVWDGHVLEAAGQLIADFHRAATFAHGDLAPWNTVFRNGLPYALIDFDKANTEMPHVEDAAYAVWTWLGLGEHEGIYQKARMKLFTASMRWSKQEILAALRRVLTKYAAKPDTRIWAENAQSWCERTGFFNAG